MGPDRNAHEQTQSAVISLSLRIFLDDIGLGRNGYSLPGGQVVAGSNPVAPTNFNDLRTISQVRVSHSTPADTVTVAFCSVRETPRYQCSGEISRRVATFQTRYLMTIGLDNG